MTLALRRILTLYLTSVLIACMYIPTPEGYFWIWQHGDYFVSISFGTLFAEVLALSALWAVVYLLALDVSPARSFASIDPPVSSRAPLEPQSTAINYRYRKLSLLFFSIGTISILTSYLISPPNVDGPLLLLVALTSTILGNYLIAAFAAEVGWWAFYRRRDGSRLLFHCANFMIMSWITTLANLYIEFS